MKDKKETNGLFELFIEELEDLNSSEHQIIEALPKIIKAASLPDLKDAISHHLKETENQVVRIQEIFKILELKSKQKTCEAMEGLLKEGDELIKSRAKSPTLDAAIIAACQKVEHYEIASYGTLRSFAEQLDLDDEIINLIQDTLDEEGAADKKLTKIAEGSFFKEGVNQEAAEKPVKAKK